MANFKQNADGSVGIISDITGVESFRAGGPKSIGAPGAGVSQALFSPGSCIKLGPIAGLVATTGGAIAAWTNNLGYDILIHRCVVDPTTASTGAANLTIGQTPTSITTSSTNILSATAINATTVVGATTQVKCKNGEFITMQGSADTTGLIMNVYLYFVPA